MDKHTPERTMRERERNKTNIYIYTVSCHHHRTPMLFIVSNIYVLCHAEHYKHSKVNAYYPKQIFFLHMDYMSIELKIEMVQQIEFSLL